MPNHGISSRMASGTPLPGQWAVDRGRLRAGGDLHHPADSPLHYLAYVQVYGSTPDVVYEGYTPGLPRHNGCR